MWKQELKKHKLQYFLLLLFSIAICEKQIGTFFVNYDLNEKIHLQLSGLQLQINTVCQPLQLHVCWVMDQERAQVKDAFLFLVCLEHRRYFQGLYLFKVQWQ